MNLHKSKFYQGRIKMKKTVISFFALAVCFVILFAFVSCGDEASTSHEHSPSDWIVGKDPTCKEEGEKHLTCTDCGKILQTEAIEKLTVHSSSGWIEDKAATCKVPGTQHKECTVCGTVLETDEIPMPTEHTPSDWITDTESTCTEQGTKHKECTLCNDVLETDNLPLAEHVYENLACVGCGRSYYAEGLSYTKQGNTYVVSGLGTCTDTEIRIPPTYKELKVVGIADGAFSGNTAITEVVIPNNVTSIGASAFEDCSSITKIEIPDTVTTIGNSAFHRCKALKSAKLPSGVTVIGEYLFSGCSALVSIEFSPNVTSIGQYAFSDCIALESFDIPKGLTEINVGMLNNCPSVREIVIPEKVTYINASAFSDCRSLKAVKIPDAVTVIEGGAFSGCSGLRSVEFGENSKLTKIGRVAFCNCWGLTRFIIPDKVTLVDVGAFDYCSNLTHITVGKSVNKIGPGVSGANSVFSNCVKLVEIYNLSSLTFRKGSATDGGIAEHALNIYTPTSGASKLHYTLDDFVVYIDGDTCYFMDYIGEESAIVLPDNFEGRNYTIYNRAFASSDGLLRVVIPSTILGIQNVAFINSPELTICFTANYPSGLAKNWNSKSNPVITNWTYGKHLPAEWETVTEATCKADGKKVLKCAECGEVIESQTVPAGPHTPSDWKVESEPTCKTAGVKYTECTVCGERLDEASIERLPHTPGDWVVSVEQSCKEPGQSWKFCTVCNAAVDHMMYEKLPHKESEEKRIEPTCKDDGLKYTECTKCGDILSSETIAKLSHNLSAWEKVSAATCQSGGTEVQKCTLCKDVINTRQTAVGFHSFVGDSCSVCGRGYSQGLKFTVSSDHATLSGLGTCTDTDLVIPPTYNGLPVTHLDDGLSSKNQITSIMVPDTVTGITWYFFSACEYLEKLYIPDSLTGFGSNQFGSCKKLTVYCEAESLPSGWSSEWNMANRPVVWGYKIGE